MPNPSGLPRLDIPASVLSFPQIEVNKLAAKGCLAEGAGGKLLFELAAEKWFEVDYRITQRSDGTWCLVLAYDTDRPVSMEVEFNTSEMVHKRLRWWFTCPSEPCGRRVGKLYLRGDYWCCRLCHNLYYREWIGHHRKGSVKASRKKRYTNGS